MVTITNLETQVAAKIAALDGSQTIKELMILKKSAENTSVDITALDTRIDTAIAALTGASTDIELLLSNKSAGLSTSSGGGLPINSIIPLETLESKHVASDGSEWLKTGSLETNSVEYPDATQTSYLNISSEKHRLLSPILLLNDCTYDSTNTCYWLVGSCRNTQDNFMVHRYDTSMNYVSSIRVPSSQTTETMGNTEIPYGVCVDSSGNLRVMTRKPSNTGNMVIIEVTTAGEFVSWLSVASANCRQLCSSGSKLFIVNQSATQYLEFEDSTSNGALVSLTVRVIVEVTANTGGIEAVGLSLYVGDSTVDNIEKYTISTGAYSSNAGTVGVQMEYHRSFCYNSDTSKFVHFPRYGTKEVYSSSITLTGFVSLGYYDEGVHSSLPLSESITSSTVSGFVDSSGNYWYTDVTLDKLYKFSTAGVLTDTYDVSATTTATPLASYKQDTSEIILLDLDSNLSRFWLLDLANPLVVVEKDFSHLDIGTSTQCRGIEWDGTHYWINNFIHKRVYKVTSALTLTGDVVDYSELVYYSFVLSSMTYLSILGSKMYILGQAQSIVCERIGDTYSIDHVTYVDTDQNGSVNTYPHFANDGADDVALVTDSVLVGGLLPAVGVHDQMLDTDTQRPMYMRIK